MLRAFIIPVLTIASFLPAVAGESYTPVTSAVYHPALDHQTAPITQVDYRYSHRRRRHRHRKAAKRIGLGAAGGAAIGAVAGGGDLHPFFVRVPSKFVTRLSPER